MLSCQHWFWGAARAALDWLCSLARRDWLEEAGVAATSTSGKDGGGPDKPWSGSCWACVRAEGSNVGQRGVWGKPITIRTLPLGYQVGTVGLET